MGAVGLGLHAPEIETCSYGRSRLVCRGPARSLQGIHVAALGGAGTFGKGVARPWPQLLEAALGQPVVNFGAVGAGVDALLADETLCLAAGRAEVAVLQLPGAGALGNPYYRVHPRRNDRVIGPTPALQALYPEVDFCEFSFARHLLGTLERRCPQRFARLAAVLQATWVERMGLLLSRIDSPVVLLWLAQGRPPAVAEAGPVLAPSLVTRPMLEALRPCAADLVEVAVPADATGPAGLPGPSTHQAVATALARRLQPAQDAARPHRRASG